MSVDRQNEPDIDRLLKRVLKDDLPPETEFRMRNRLSAFRRAGSRGIPALLGQWLSRPLMSRKRALAYASAVMLTAGAVIHLGGYQSLLADSISLLKTSMLLTGKLRLASSMDCVIRTPAADAQVTIYRIRWVRDGRTRVDVRSPRGVEGTVWITGGLGTASDMAAASPESVAKAARDLPEAARMVLSPADLAGKIEECWQLEPESRRHGPDLLVYLDRQDRAVIEVRLDRKTSLPVSLSRTTPGAGGTGGTEATAEFTWNQRITPELMLPRPGSGK